jgi:hypothetical protein
MRPPGFREKGKLSAVIHRDFSKALVGPGGHIARLWSKKPEQRRKRCSGPNHAEDQLNLRFLRR